VSYEWFVASRYLRARGRTRFRSLITVLAVGGVSLGVAAAIIALGVMNGFTREVRDRIVGTNGHLVLLDRQEEGIPDVDALRTRIEAVPGIVATAPFVYGKVLLTSDSDSEGAILRGLDRETEAAVTDVPRWIFPADASFEPETNAQGDLLPGVVLGTELARKLHAGLGSEIAVTVPNARRRGVPRIRTFVVNGLFECGIYEFDSALAITSITASRDALDLGDRVTGVLARTREMDRAREIGTRVVEEIQAPPLWANNWIDQNRQLFLWMKLEKMVGYLIFAIILVVAAFLIASTLIMIVLEKTREIGVLMSLGTARRGVQRIFLLEGLAIGGLGTVIGVATGLVACWGLDRYRLPLPGDIYFIDTLPVRIWWGDLVMVAGLSLAICLVSALYPSWRASLLQPVEAIRYE
jgi:lipoprotein-releasing system permease protein